MVCKQSLNHLSTHENMLNIMYYQQSILLTDSGGWYVNPKIIWEWIIHNSQRVNIPILFNTHLISFPLSLIKIPLTC